MNQQPYTRGKNWLSSLELSQQLSQDRRRSTQVQASPVSPPTSPLRDPDRLQKIACCRLESSKGSGQCVLVHLGDLAKPLNVCDSPPLALLTAHHVIPDLEHVKEWKLFVDSEPKRYLKLSDDKFTDCISCCGPNGIWNESIHAPQSAAYTPLCPVGADFTLLVLSQHFVREIISKKDVLIPPTVNLSMRSLECALQSNQYSIIKRDGRGSIIQNELLMQRIDVARDERSLENEVASYKDSSLLRYRCNLGIVGQGDSGAGVFYCDQTSEGKELVLLGLHISTSGDEGGELMHNGITLHAIFHAIIGGPKYGIVPALSFLRDASVHDRLSPTWYEKLQQCLEDQSDQREEVNLARLLRVLDFLLKSEPPILRLLKDKKKLSILSSLKLLSLVFSCFERFGGPAAIGAEVATVFPGDGTAVFLKGVEGVACLQVYDLLKYAYEQSITDIVEACFDCWLKMCHSGVSACRTLYDAEKCAFLKGIRGDERYSNNVVIQKLFGDICLAYQMHLRGEIHERVQKVAEEELEDVRRACQHQLAQQAQQFEQEREEREQRVQEQIRMREQEMQQELRNSKEEGEVQLREERRALEQRVQESEEHLQQIEALKNRAEQELVEKNLVLEQVQGEKSRLNQENEAMAKELVEKIRALDQAQGLNQEVEGIVQELTNENERLTERTKQLGERVDEEVVRAHQLEEEKLLQRVEVNQLRVQCEVKTEKIGELQQRLGVNEHQRHASLPAQTLSQYPTRANRTSLLKPESEKNFRERGMSSVLQDLGVREKIGELFNKVKGATAGSWDYLLQYLKINVGVDMNPDALEHQPVGEIVAQIVQEWGKKEKVTVQRFCEVSRNLGNTRVVEILEEVEQAELEHTLPTFTEHSPRDSDTQAI